MGAENDVFSFRDIFSPVVHGSLSLIMSPIQNQRTSNIFKYSAKVNKRVCYITNRYMHNECHTFRQPENKCTDPLSAKVEVRTSNGNTSIRAYVQGRLPIHPIHWSDTAFGAINSTGLGYVMGYISARWDNR